MGWTSVLIQHRCVEEFGTRFSRAAKHMVRDDCLDPSIMDDQLERCPILNLIHGFRSRLYRKGVAGELPMHQSVSLRAAGG
jgi:hypothetical protein